MNESMNEWMNELFIVFSTVTNIKVDHFMFVLVQKTEILMHFWLFYG